MQPTGQTSQTSGRLSARMDLRAGGVVAAYAIFATLWILFSDRALGLIYADPERLMEWSVYKGIGFVVVTAVLLLLLMRRVFGRMAEDNAIMQAQGSELRRLQRLYVALCQVNQAIVRMQAREELCQEICRVLVEHGGFGLAWIGWNDPATRRMAPLAKAGDPADYIKDIQVYTDDRPEGRGPAGRAFRTGQPQVSNDLYNDPAVLQWREEIMRRGFRAAAFFPIRERKAVAGVLCVYAETTGYFQDKEIALLSEAAADVSAALDNLIRDDERRVAEDTARQEKTFSDTMIASMPGVVYFYDMKGRFLRWNRNFETETGHSAAEQRC